MKKRIIFILCLAVIAALSFYFLSGKKKNDVLLQTTFNTSSSAIYTSLSPTSIFFTDMEDPEVAVWMGRKDPDKSLSGKYSSKLSGNTEFGITFFKTAGDLENYSRTHQIKVSFSVYSDSPIQHGAIVFAVSGTSKDTVYDYRTAGINGKAHQWTMQEMVFNVNAESWNKDCQVKIYPWNPAKETFFVDDIKIEFYSEEAHEIGIHSYSKLNFIHDYETPDSSDQDDDITDDVAHSGKHALLLSAFGSTAPIMKKFGDVAKDSIEFISTSVWIYPKSNNPSLEIVASIESPDGNTIAESTKKTKRMILKKKEWQKINFRADFRGRKAGPDDIIKIYISNNGFGSVYIDDFEIIYGDIPLPNGGQPGIAADMAGKIIMRSGKNKPPFKQEYFWECEENAMNLFTGIKNGGTLEPGSKMIAGNFLNAGDNHDDLLMVMNNQWSIFRWCDTENNLVRIVKSVPGPEEKGRKIMKGYFSESSKEEVILIDTMHQTDAKIVRFNSTGDVCKSEITQAPVLEITDVKFTGLNFQAGSNEIYCGNFKGNKFSEVLFINKKTGNWQMFEYSKQNFTEAASGALPEGSFISGLQFNSDGNYDRLVVFCERKKEIEYYMIDFSSNANHSSVTAFTDKSFLQNFGFKSEIFSLALGKSQRNELFYFNNDWRLDLKRISIDATGLNVESQIEFYRNDTLNPKFFEYLQIIPGKFFQNQTELLILTRNCKDKSSDGRNCNEFEKPEGLPPGFMIYRFIPAK